MMVQLSLSLLYFTSVSAITNSYVAPDGKYPYHVSIRDQDEHMCSGSIIDERHILTSQWCITRFAWYSIKNLRVIVGTNSRETSEHSHEIREIIKSDGIKDGIALLRTCNRIRFNNKVRPIKITAYNYKRNGYPITLTAWKQLASGKPNTDKLHAYDYEIYDQSKCMKTYSYVTENHLCTIKSDRQRICHLDSGGAIVANNYLIGVKLHGDTCMGEKPEVNLQIEFIDI